MSEFETSYVPGQWVSAAGSESWLLADIDPSDPTVLSCWALLRDGAAIDAVLDVLLSRGLRSVPGFALVRLTEAGGATVVVRGSASVAARGGPIDQEIDGAEAASWREATIAPGFTQLRLQASEDSPASPEEFAALSPGLTLAATVRIALAPEQPAPAATDQAGPAAAASELNGAGAGWAADEATGYPVATVVEPSAGYIAAGGPGAIGLSAAMAAEAVLAPTVGVEDEDERAGTEQAAGAAEEAEQREAWAEPGEGVEPDEAAAAEQGEAPVAEQGEALAEKHGEAPVAEQGEALAEEHGEALAEEQREVVADQPAGAETEQLPAEAAAGFPSAPTDGAKPAVLGEGAEVPELADLGEHGNGAAAAQDEERAESAAGEGVLPPTEAIASEDLLEFVDEARDDSLQAADASAGPLVDAVRCERGHYNPLTVGVCRVCGVPLQSQVPVRIPRPPLGVLRLSTGDVVPLDRDVVLGRNPTPEAAGLPADAHVVSLASPNHDMSRTHAAIHLDGWIVLLADLNSTNGTIVSHPWHEAMRLRPNEPVAIEPGTVVNLANEVTFRYEPTA
jgi:hypothetical protein